MKSSINLDSQKLVKIIIVGNQAAGKSSLITRYFDKKFGNSVSTYGIDYRIEKNFQSQNQKIYQVSIWDTAGQEQYRSVVKFSCKGSHGAIVCFDMTDLSSLLSVKEWFKFLRKNCDCAENIIYAIVGTKLDKEEDLLENDKIQQVIEEIRQQSTNEIKYFETSSKTKQGVYEMFYQMFNLVTINYEKYFLQNEVNIQKCKLTEKRITESQTQQKINGNRCC